jgi:hypothetical protein
MEEFKNVITIVFIGIILYSFYYLVMLSIKKLFSILIVTLYRIFKLEKKDNILEQQKDKPSHISMKTEDRYPEKRKLSTYDDYDNL